MVTTSCGTHNQQCPHTNPYFTEIKEHIYENTQWRKVTKMRLYVLIAKLAANTMSYQAMFNTIPYQNIVGQIKVDMHRWRNKEPQRKYCWQRREILEKYGRGVKNDWG